MKLSVADMIQEVVKRHGAPFDPDKPDELTDWVRAYYPERKVKSETVRRTAQKLRAGTTGPFPRAGPDPITTVKNDKQSILYETDQA